MRAIEAKTFLQVGTRVMFTGPYGVREKRVYPFSEAGEALRHLIEDWPFGKVVVAW